MEHRVVKAVNFAHQPLQKRATCLRLIAFQDSACKKRDDRERNNHRCRNRYNDGADEALDEFARPFRQKEQGQKGKDQNAGRPQNRHRNFFGAVNRRFASAFPHA